MAENKSIASPACAAPQTESSKREKGRSGPIEGIMVVVFLATGLVWLVLSGLRKSKNKEAWT